MKYLFLALTISLGICSCSKDEMVANINVEGYWQVQDPIYSFNSTRDLFHLFKGANVFYRFSFLKTHNYTNLNSKPQSDSLISFYKVEGTRLMLPNPSASATNVVPGHDLLSQTDNELVFTRYVILAKDLTGKVTRDRSDTIRYTRVSDQLKIAYLDDYIRRFHP